MLLTIWPTTSLHRAPPPEHRFVAWSALVLIGNAIPLTIFETLALGQFGPAFGFLAGETCLVAILVMDAVVD